MIIRTAGLALLMSASLAAQSPDFSPARRLSGAMPPPAPPNSAGWIVETVELSVDAAGRIVGMSVLEGTDGSSLITPALTDWTFRPAVEGGRPVPSHILVAAMFRPPVLYNGPALGSAPVTLAAPSSDVPVPSSMTPPGYPPLGVADALVLVEVLVGPDGRVQASSIINGSPGFDEIALAAARGWSFRAAQRNARPVPAYAYLIFGFRRPVGPE
jgi:TonB family protein